MQGDGRIGLGERISVPVIAAWMAEFDVQRATAIANTTSQQHKTEPPGTSARTTSDCQRRLNFDPSVPAEF
ncbi:hypothetical protein [Micromonospora arborensis]|uniref:hypothetical protein n=1 Tax=Micromonospora arborensis TaxID=2116518 RepID=UPI0037107F73